MEAGLTIDSVRSAIAERRTTAAALADEFYTKIKQEDPEIGAFLTLSKERAHAKAAEIDKLAEAGNPLPPLAGVPVALKDAMVTRDLRTRLALRADRLCVIARSHRPICENRERGRAGASHDCRPRSHGFHFRGRVRARLRRGTGEAGQGSEGGSGERIFWRRTRSRS